MNIQAQVFDSVYRRFESYRPSLMMMGSEGGNMPQYVTPVTWLAAPNLLTLAEAGGLVGLDEAELRALIFNGGIEAQCAGNTWLIDKTSLSEWLDALVDLALFTEAQTQAGEA